MRSTLLLDNGYQPLDIIKWTDAVRLLFLDKVEVIEFYEEEVRSRYLSIKMPAVVRLIRAFRRKKKKVKFSRVSIYARDNFQCQFCAKRLTMRELTFDHVVPRSRGGRTNWENIVTCCLKCNIIKANRTPEEAEMKLLKRPEEPKWISAVMIKLSERSPDQCWMDYIYWNVGLVKESS